MRFTNSAAVEGIVLENPFFKKNPGGISVCAFHLLSRELRFSEESNSMDAHAIVLDIHAAGNQADYIRDNIMKDQPVLVMGKLKEFRWKDGQGGERSKIVIAAENAKKQNNKSASDLNSVILEGKITGGPEFGRSKNGEFFCNLRIRPDEDASEYTAVLSQKQAGIINNAHIGRGNSIRIFGKLELQCQTGQNGGRYIYIAPRYIEIKTERGFANLSFFNKPEIRPAAQIRRPSFGISD
jgi:single-stranded DNA-binding protein